MKYGIRFAVNFIALNFYLCFCYVNVLSTKEDMEHVWRHWEVPSLLLLGLLMLVFIWWKFLNIWRFYRLWALLDGMEAPENMNRCICNNYSFEGFWRSWHRSYNQWLIRYLFIPLGGSKYKFVNIWVIFSFVAVWHEFNLNLVLWAWIICLFLMPEMGVKAYFNNEKVSEWGGEIGYNNLFNICTVVQCLYFYTAMH